MKAQQIFDKVATHLFKQGKPATSAGGMCRYRASDGAKCAVGALLSDRYYKEDMEGLSIRSLTINYDIPRWMDKNVNLLVDLQNVHDDCKLITPKKGNYSKPKLRKALTRVAVQHGLDASILRAL